jgi:hypothetical protein
MVLLQLYQDYETDEMKCKTVYLNICNGEWSLVYSRMEI